MTKIKTFFIEYLKHSVLNLGQALQSVRYFYSHPDIDKVAKRRAFKHIFCSIILRVGLILNDFYFTIWPPHWHHTKDDIKSFQLASTKQWFQYGYCAWRFNEKGEYKVLTGQEDRRWDPRCKE